MFGERERKAIFSAAAKREEKWMLQKFLSPRKTVSKQEERARSASRVVV